MLILLFSLISLNSFALDCTDFSGSWIGECRNENNAFYSTRTIVQNDCSEISDAGISKKIGKLTLYEGERLIDYSRVIYDYQWMNKTEKKEIVFKKNFVTWMKNHSSYTNAEHIGKLYMSDSENLTLEINIYKKGSLMKQTCQYKRRDQ
ncbi:hypothetical protein A9Q84_16125 [Halobacteriovorax marinus]|uniref:Lipoprotein n=1 Tax=Halobacteriovorax marinus TaxID=97084 RepID=A0A1Y5FAN3_9BACT|nr:hypothetical protein A9Q84_16125 [Halobacteriovorax marinus]